MKLFPAIDLIEGCAVRLVKGDYAQKTVYSTDPVGVASSFHEAGAEFLHVVELEGARDGHTPNIDTVRRLAETGGLKVEIGGGIRSEETVKKYLDIGVMRVILGTAALTDSRFLEDMVQKYGEKIAVGVDIKDGRVAIRGWTEVSSLDCFEFCGRLQKIGVKTVICTDISKDGMLSGTNIGLYRRLCSDYPIDFVASGGVSTLEDIRELCKLDIYGAILGKALYTGNIDLREAVRYCERTRA